MKRFEARRVLLAGAIAAGFAALSACAPAPPPPPSAAPPPIVRIPQRPYPPMGAAPNLTIPPRGADGVRHTVNSGLSGAQSIWNLRSAYNVAALNCRRSEHAQILAGYSDFLKTHARTLASINQSLDRQYKEQFGSSYIRAREAYQTQVYNYFALPPVLPAFCDAALAVGRDMQAMGPGQLEGFAPIGLSRIEAAFLEFFDSYDRYRADLADWEAQYGSGSSNSAYSTTAYGPAR